MRRLRPVPRSRRRGFTLVEVLAALLFMAIVIPIAMHGVSIASRAGILGQRKAAAIRVAERVLDESFISGQLGTTATNGTTTDGETTYTWTLQTQPWTEDTMTTATVTVSFDVQGNTFDISLTTLFDPTTTTAMSTGATTP